MGSCLCLSSVFVLGCGFLALATAGSGSTAANSALSATHRAGDSPLRPLQLGAKLLVYRSCRLWNLGETPSNGDHPFATGLWHPDCSSARPVCCLPFPPGLVVVVMFTVARSRSVFASAMAWKRHSCTQSHEQARSLARGLHDM